MCRISDAVQPTTRAVPLTKKPSMIVRSPTVDRKRPSRARAAGEEPVVEPVEVVFLVEQRVDRAGGALQPLRQRRIDEVAVPGRDDPGDGEPERQAQHAMLHEGADAVPFLAQLLERRVLGPDDDGVAEIVADHHRLDVRPARVHRRDREQDQRHRHHPGAFLRRCHGRAPWSSPCARVMVVGSVGANRSLPWNARNSIRNE